MPDVPTIASGSRLTPERLMFVARKPIARLRRVAAQSIASGGSYSAISWDTEDEDTDPDGTGGHSTSVNTSRYTVRYPGVYRLSGGIGYAGNTTGVRGCAWLLNGATIDGSDVMLQAVGDALTATRVPARAMLVRLGEGDYVELGAFQNSGGGALNTATTSAAPNMNVEWVRV